MVGRLVYLMGPSGSGKDSLIDAARARLEAAGFVFERRIITRSAESVGEDAIGVSQETFERMDRQGAFALAWSANQLCYGIPVDIDAHLKAGHSVLVNGSRGYLPEARVRYPDLLAVVLEVAPDILRRRLELRGRESRSQIEDRLNRNAAFTDQIQALRASGQSIMTVDNSSTLEEGVQRLLAIIAGAQNT